MKKQISLALAGVMALSLAACGRLCQHRHLHFRSSFHC